MEQSVGASWLGGHLKFAVSMSCPGFDMETDDWRITVTRRDKSVVFTKENAVNDGEQWYICLDSSEIGVGTVFIIFEAFVPDGDFPDGIRREVERYELIRIKNIPWHVLRLVSGGQLI